MSPKFDWNQYNEAGSNAGPPPAGKFDWNQFKEELPQPVYKPGILGTLKAAADKIDSYTGAPTRAAVGALQDEHNMLGAFTNQFGADPRLAPTAKDIVAKANVPDFDISRMHPILGIAKAAGYNPTFRDAAELAVNAGADWTNLIPVVGEAKALLAGSKAAEMAGDVAKGAKGLAGSLGAKIGETATGVPAREIKTYAGNLEELNGRIKQAGADTSLLANQSREGFQNAIQNTRKAQNTAITDALKSASPDAVHDIAPVVESLEKAKSRVNPKFDDEGHLAQIDKMIQQVKDAATDGKVSSQDLFDMQKTLRNKANGSFANGQFFTPGDAIQNAAKSGAAEARKILNTAHPDIANANNTLASLHEAEEMTPRNLITPETSDSAIYTAGGADSSINRNHLKSLGEITGTDMIGEAEKLAAMKRFANPSWTEAGSGGKSLVRRVIGASIGGAAAGPKGAMFGMVGGLTSPAALKAAINTGDISAGVIKKLAGTTEAITDATIGRAFQTLQTPAGQAILKASREFESTSPTVRKVAGDQSSSGAPLRGEDLWAQHGINNLGINDSALTQKLLQSPEGKQLLIQASDLQPGSKAMQRIQDQIQKGWGRKP